MHALPSVSSVQKTIWKDLTKFQIAVLDFIALYMIWLSSRCLSLIFLTVRNIVICKVPWTFMVLYKWILLINNYMYNTKCKYFKYLQEQSNQQQHMLHFKVRNAIRHSNRSQWSPLWLCHGMSFPSASFSPYAQAQLLKLRSWTQAWMSAQDLIEHHSLQGLPERCYGQWLTQ